MSFLDKIFIFTKYFKDDIKLNMSTSFCSVWTCFVFSVLCVIPAIEKMYKSQIECISDIGETFQKAVDNFCLIQGKFTIEFDNQDKEVFVINKHSYYIWVPYIMFICAISSKLGLFFYKYVFWGNYLDLFIQSMKAATDIDSSMSKDNVKLYMNNLFTIERIQADAVKWTFSFLVLELVNCLTPIIIHYGLNLFMGSNFLTLGFYFYDQHKMDTIYPKMGKCTFHKYGPSGTLINFDSLCVFSNNVLNEKLFLCVWFWLCIMYLVGIWTIFQRTLTLLIFKSRCFYYCAWSNAGISMSVNFKKFQKSVLKNCSYCQWLYLYYICKNMNFQMFNVLLQHLDNSHFYNEDCDLSLLKEPVLSEPNEYLYSGNSVHCDEGLTNDTNNVKFILNKHDFITVLRMLVTLLQGHFTCIKDLQKEGESISPNAYKVKFSSSGSVNTTGLINCQPTSATVNSENTTFSNDEGYDCKIDIDNGPTILLLTQHKTLLCHNDGALPASLEEPVCEIEVKHQMANPLLIPVHRKTSPCKSTVIFSKSNPVYEEIIDSESDEGDGDSFSTAFEEDRGSLSSNIEDTLPSVDPKSVSSFDRK